MVDRVLRALDWELDLSVSKRFWTAVVVATLGLGVVGCDPGAPAPSLGPPRYEGVEVKLGVIGDPQALVTADLLARDWAASRKASLSVAKEPIDLAKSSGLDVDVVVFPADRLGDLIDKQAIATISLSDLLDQPLNNDSKKAVTKSEESEGGSDRPVYALDSVLRGPKDVMGKYGADRFALTYGGSVLVLAYRRDALENASAKLKEEALAAKVDLRAPATWDQLENQLRFFQNRDWNQDGQADFAIAMPWSATDPQRTGAFLVLARAASLGRHQDQFSFEFDFETMKPGLQTPPFLEALGALAAWKTLGPPDLSGSADIEAARKAFREGKTVFLIDRAEKAASWTDPAKKFPIGVARLPGSTKVYKSISKTWETPAQPNQPAYLPQGGGWLVAVSSKTIGAAHIAAQDLAKHLSGPEVATQVARDRTSPLTPVRKDKMIAPSAPGLDISSWSNAVTRSLDAPIVIPSLRIPNADAYLADLANAAHNVVHNQAKPDAALEQTAKAWSNRVQSQGLDRQKWHYARSLLEVPTSDLPPPIQK